MKKKLAFVLLLLTAVLCASLSGAFASGDDACEVLDPENLLPFTYTITDGEATITGYTGNAAEIVIPDAIAGYPVTKLEHLIDCGCDDDSGASQVTWVTVPRSVTSFGSGFHYMCRSNLRFRVYADSYAHNRAIWLEWRWEVIDPDTIPFTYSVLYDYMPLIRITGYTGSQSAVVIPETIADLPVTDIGNYAFSDCDGVTHITLPDSLLGIGESAFSSDTQISMNCNPRILDDLISQGYEGQLLLSHRSVIQQAAVAATCTTDGLTEGSYCTACSTALVAQEIIPAAGHAEAVLPGKAATCTESGLTDGKRCSVCGTTTLAQRTIPASGHAEVIDQAVAVTCTADGLTEGRHCAVCDAVLTAQAVLPAPGHVEGAPIVLIEPTETSDGAQIIQCVTCKEILRSESIPATGTARVPGDLNEDGKINSRDALAIIRYVVGQSVSINAANADVNADGKINSRDALAIIRYVVGQDVTLK